MRILFVLLFFCVSAVSQTAYAEGMLSDSSGNSTEVINYGKSSLADSINILSTVPEVTDTISGGRKVSFTFTVNYNLVSAASGAIWLWVRGYTPCEGYLVKQNRVSVAVGMGSGQKTVSSTAIIMCNDGVTEITSLKVGVTLIPEGFGGGPADSVYYDNISYSVTPEIKANESNWPLTIKQSDILSITVQVNPRDKSGSNADWWVVADTPLGWYYDNLTSGWQSGMKVTYQGPLFNLAPYQVLNMSNLPLGSYTFYFGVDMLMNGVLNMGPGEIYYDSVKVNVTP